MPLGTPQNTIKLIPYKTFRLFNYFNVISYVVFTLYGSFFFFFFQPKRVYIKFRVASDVYHNYYARGVIIFLFLCYYKKGEKITLLITLRTGTYNNVGAAPTT